MRYSKLNTAQLVDAVASTKDALEAVRRYLIGLRNRLGLYANPGARDTMATAAEQWIAALEVDLKEIEEEWARRRAQ
jgi:hypothetical protein